jgi:hypothetical protein
VAVFAIFFIVWSIDLPMRNLKGCTAIAQQARSLFPKRVVLREEAPGAGAFRRPRAGFPYSPGMLESP